MAQGTQTRPTDTSTITICSAPRSNASFFFMYHHLSVNCRSDCNCCVALRYTYMDQVNNNFDEEKKKASL